MQKPHRMTRPPTASGARVAGRRCLGAAAGTLSIASLAMAGCGGGAKTTAAAIDSTAPAITKGEFVRKANAICAKGNVENRAAGAKLGAEPSEAQVLAFVKRTEVPAVQAQIAALKALGAPRGDEATVAKMLTLAQAAVDAVKAQPTIVTTGANVFARFARLAHPYGLTSCSPTS
ncbi:MAG: hypothetical protein QOG40_1339 [Solirubrobacteraceae bacterium]|nr:hypothetical protein [Solirubrobacteraceae bacterium]